MQRILLGLGTIAVLGGLVVGGSGAFFNDTETSTGNTFTAGDIDLKIDNSSYAIDFNIPTFQGEPTGALVANPANSWSLADLVAGTHKFFTFSDLKPGDYGEDTISVHVGSNNAWMCAAARITSDLDNSITEPEDESDLDDDNADATPDGDLDSALNFAFWVDDGDNVLEDNEYDGGAGIFLQGSLANMGAAGAIALADSAGSVLPSAGPVPGNSTFYIGKGWCYGAMTPNPVVQDNATTSSPLILGTGFTCNGSSIGNEGQTDSVEGDMQFYAVQSRNNPNFSCSTWTPTWPTVGPVNEITQDA
jgi:predicted ribosomally synthesized peptide with SipW-like signal peptide